MESPSSRNAVALKNLTAFCRALTVCVGAAAISVLWGWHSDSDILKGLIPGRIAMNPMTAVAFLLLSGAIFMKTSDLSSKWLVPFLGFSVALVGLSRLSGYFLTWDPALDTALFSAKLSGNHMAPNTASAFILLGTAAGLSHLKNRAALIPQALAVLTGLIAFLAVAGYFYGSGALYQVAVFIPMALNTALAFGALSLAFLATNPDVGFMGLFTSNSLGGMTVRRLWPATLLVAPLVGLIWFIGEKTKFYGSELSLAMMVVGQLVILSGIVFTVGRSIHNVDLSRERAETKARKAKVAAETANRAKGEFLATMSHELRTPLNAVIGFSDILKEEGVGSLNAKQKEYISDISEAGKHLLSLINDILDLTKVEAGKMELHPEDCDLEAVVKNSLMMVRERAMNNDIQMHSTLEEDLGLVRADQRKLKQILYNLLSNAAKFTPRGGHIGLEIHRNNSSELEISVWDNGIGIAPEDRSKLFQEFVRLDNSYARSCEGTGLGLALTKRLVELHGGRIWFESPGAGQGTRFHFTLPLAPHAETFTPREMHA